MVTTTHVQASMKFKPTNCLLNGRVYRNREILPPQKSPSITYNIGAPPNPPPTTDLAAVTEPLEAYYSDNP